MIKAIIWDLIGVLHHGPDDEKMREVLDNDFQNILLTNCSQSIRHELGFLDKLDAAYYSDTGFQKPMKEAYLNVLSKEGLKPEECLFFDDSQKNVDAASSLGIKSYLFEGVEEAKKVIADSSQRSLRSGRDDK